MRRPPTRRARAWGDNISGESNVPAWLNQITAIATGDGHTLALVTDRTPPVITPSVVGTLGPDGWYTSDVTVTWSVADYESPIQSRTGCGPSIINTDTNGVTFTCTATNAGGTSSQSATIKLRRTL